MTDLSPPSGRVHLLVFSDGTQPFHDNARALCQMAAEAGFDSATHETAERLEAEGFWDQFPTVPRGGWGVAFGVWRPFLLRRALDRLGPDDIVIVHDAGSHAPGALRDLPRLPARLLALCRAAPQGFVHGSASAWSAQEHLTKRDCLTLLEADTPEARQAPFLHASPLIYRPTAQAMAFLDDWMAACADPRLLTDQPDQTGAPNPLMRRHQHAEAIGSILAHQRGAAYLDLQGAAPDLLEGQRRRMAQIATPSAHLAVIATVIRRLEEADDQAALSALVPALSGAPLRRIPRNRPSPVVQREAVALATRGGGAICRDHLQHVIGQNRVLGARLHGLKDMIELEPEFWRRATAQVNLQLADRAIAGIPVVADDLPVLVRDAVHHVLEDMADLAAVLMAACAWARMGTPARDAFKAVHGSHRDGPGHLAMLRLADALAARGFPGPALEQSGDIEDFDRQLNDLVLAWLDGGPAEAR